MAASTSVSVAVAHAVAYLTRPLIVSHSATTIIKLQLVLEANLTALFAPSWVPNEPLRGSGRRCLTLSPNCLPPRAVYSACLATGVQWFDWITLLGGREFDFFVDPGCISLRFGKDGKPFTIWSDAVGSAKSATTVDETALQAQLRGQAAARAKAQVSARLERKTLAQQLLEEDKVEDDQLFAMIADEVAAPTWMTPVLDKFPIPPRSVSPLSAVSTHSRSSSRSSNSSAGFSFTSADTFDTLDSFASMTTFSSTASQAVPDKEQGFKLSRRERARQARVFVDTSKTEVTPYDGGKTTVLTGGVMLGGGPKPKAKKAAPPTAIQASNSWRSIRA
jgi:hypothetical protein